MSPHRKHGGGRPRSAHSVLDFAERWGISAKSARRLAGRPLSDEAIAILVSECHRFAAAQRCQEPLQAHYTRSMRGLGMRSRVPAARAGSRP